MSSQAIGQRFRVSRGGCWQCLPDCRSRLAEDLTFSSVAYNGELDAVQRRDCASGMAASGYWWPFFFIHSAGGKKATR